MLPAGSVPIVELLAEHGASIGAATHMGDTPLQLAARAGHDRMVARLLSPPPAEGASEKQDPHVHAADRLGWTALHCAAQHGSLTVTNLLLQVKLLGDPALAGCEVDSVNAPSLCVCLSE